MNDNEYGKFSYNKTDDGKKELRVSDKDNFDDVVTAFRENNLDPNVKDIDQITIVAGGEKRENQNRNKLAEDLVTDLINLDMAKKSGNPNAKPHLSKITIAIIVIMGLIVVGIMLLPRLLI